MLSKKNIKTPEGSNLLLYINFQQAEANPNLEACNPKIEIVKKKEAANLKEKKTNMPARMPN